MAAGAPTKSQLRLALVMNGGVSLAVWMGGVTREIDALLHAHEQPLEGTDTEHCRVWRDVLKASGRPSVAVDLVAGTSAGGLNGALLASAVARGEPLAQSVKKVWLSAGDLSVDHLVPRPDSHERSLLAGDFFLRQVREALGLEAQGPEVDLDDLEDTQAPYVPAVNDITLLMTATALPQPVRPSSASVDSRRVYQFRALRRTKPALEGWEHNDFARFAETLARTARSSASFPGAFDPVFESENMRHLRTQAGAEGPPRAYLVDGGVLDNAPFGPLLDRLRVTPVDAPYDRMLIYVKPSVVAARLPAQLTESSSLGTVLGRVVSAAREPDERQDGEELDFARDDMRYTATEQHLLLSRLWTPNSRPTPPQVIAAATALLPLYAAGRQQALNLPPMPADEESDPPPAANLPTPHGDLASLRLDPDPQHPEQLRWGVGTAERLIRWWSRMLRTTSAPVPDHRFAAAFDAVADARRYVTLLLDELGSEWPSGAQSDEVAGRLWVAATATAAVLPGNPTPTEFMAASLAVEVVSMPFQWGTQDRSDPPLFSYRVITPDVEPLIDVGATGQRPWWAEHHLYGTQWGHFGAFGKEEWREHDWLWGRLDGAKRLAEILLAEAPQTTQHELLDRLGKAILADEGRTIDDVQALSRSVVSADGATLWKQFATGMKPTTRRAIVAKLESLPRRNLPPQVANLTLAAVGTSLPPATPSGPWWTRTRQRATLMGVRTAFWLPRRYLHRKIARQLTAGD